MPDTPKRRVYWDACVFLSYVEERAGRADAIELFLEDADKGNVEILTSTISIVEVAFAKQEKDKRALDVAAETRINELWGASSPVKLVEYNPTIAFRAQRLVRESVIRPGKTLKPMDAIHIATALVMEIDEIHTYDGGFHGLSSTSGLTVREVPLIQLRLDLSTGGRAELPPGP